MEKKNVSGEKYSDTQDLNIFAGINFCECYRMKYLVVPNFCELAKKHEIMKFFSWKFLTFIVVETFSGEKPLPLGNSSDASQDEMTVTEIISICGNYPTI